MAVFLSQKKHKHQDCLPQLALLLHSDLFLIYLFFLLAYLKIYMLYNVYFKKSLTTYCILMSGYTIVL